MSSGLTLKPVSKHRRGNRSAHDARNWPQDPDHISPALRARLLAHPEEVAWFTWIKPWPGGGNDEGRMMNDEGPSAASVSRRQNLKPPPSAISVPPHDMKPGNDHHIPHSTFHIPPSSGPPRVTGERQVFTLVSEEEFRLLKWCNSRAGGSMSQWLKDRLLEAAADVVAQEQASGKPVPEGIVALVSRNQK